MRADEVCAALTTRWPDSEFLHIREAPEDSSRQGRKLDVLVVSLWKSRGFQIDGIEVKVSMADAMRELVGSKVGRGRVGGPEKADWWWRHVDRFWMATPLDLAEKLKVNENFPDTWGILGITDEFKVKEIKKAPRHEPEKLPWHTVIGLLRAAADSGMGALERARSIGHEQGREAAKKQFERSNPSDQMRTAFEELRAKVNAFEKASGVKFSHIYSADEAERVGKLYALAERTLFSRHTMESLSNLAANLTRQGARLEELAQTAAQILEPAEAS